MSAPCRLFVYLAREAPLGVVLRRGPSAWVRLSLWHTDTDTFEHGQWMKRRVYERRGDLSADGSLFVYFAFGVAQSTAMRQGANSWVALSRPPFFTALALWFVGGTYHTGGFFPARRSVWPGFGAGPPDQGSLPHGLNVVASPLPYVDHTPDWPEQTVFVNRLLRDGWERAGEAVPEIWRRTNPAGDMALIMRQTAFDFAAYGGPYVMDYAVEAGSGEPPIPLGRATWADWDQRGRLLLARDGRLSCWQPPDTLHPIADFNAQVPAPVPAPAWATTWPRLPSTR